MYISVPKKKIPRSQNKEDETSVFQMSSYLRLASKYRRPSSMVPRLGIKRFNVPANAINYPTIKPPYGNDSLDRFEDTFRSDKLIQNAIIKRVEMVLGQHGKLVLDTTEEFDTEDERKTALENVKNNEKYQEARKKVQALNLKPAINFHSNLKAAEIQKRVYGRAAIEMVESTTGDNDLPTALHVLNSKRLAQVEVNPQTWEFVGVRYLDLSKGASGQDDILEADDIIYFANKDYHVSPGSLYYGLSELEGVVDGSDSKRIAKQEDIKEVMKTNWAPFLMMMFKNPNITDTQIQKVLDQIVPGLPVAHKHDVESQVVDLKSDLKQIWEAVDFLNRESLRELGVPAFIGGYEQIANYANSQQVLLAWKEIELESDRAALKDIIQPQWLNRLFYRLLGIDLEAGDEPEVKLSYEFVGDITFETKLDKVNADLLLFDRKLITGERVLKSADYEDEIEEYKLREKEIEAEEQRQEELRQQQFNQFKDIDQGRGTNLQEPNLIDVEQRKKKMPDRGQVSTTPRKR
jgi:hypothetical protein